MGVSGEISGCCLPASAGYAPALCFLVPWVPAALALVFHLADGHRGPVGFASTLRALHWSAYLETHARRCYGVAQHGEADTARRIPERITKGDLPRGGFVGWNVWRPGWSGLADQKRVTAGLDLLVELGHLEARQEPSRGRR